MCARASHGRALPELLGSLWRVLVLLRLCLCERHPRQHMEVWVPRSLRGWHLRPLWLHVAEMG